MKFESTHIDLKEEKREILRRYRGLLRSAKRSSSVADKKRLRKAFDVALEAHKEDRRKSGEPYIYHPIAVARIVAEEIGLDTTSIVAALLHDTVEDTYITLDDIENIFGPKERYLIDGLTKISDVFEYTTSIQAENFRKMLLTLSDDVRVILIKVADRLHNMRTLDHMDSEKQRKIASETLYMFAPLAHRLGLYSIKTELEDLSLKYTQEEAYHDIEKKLKKTQSVRTRFINTFSSPIVKSLDSENFQYELKGRTKSIYSIWNKIQTKHVSFEEVYDVFAIRIIIDTDLENEKADCWKAYSIVTDYYKPNPERLRDWISTPKANGYESLHTTVMSPSGKWVEVQIRTRRMDEIAEKGFAAHWKYKGDENGEQGGLDRWLGQIRDMLDNPDSNVVDFIDDFKLNLFSDEIYVFTPQGDLKKLPKGATSLDFAFEIHTQVGARCVGAKVNHKLVPLSHKLKSGDQVEILTAKDQKPKEDWLNFVITGKAKTNIKSSLKEEMKIVARDGKEILQRKFRALKVDFLSVNVSELEKHFNLDNTLDLYYQIAIGKIDLKKLKGYEVSNGRLHFEKEEKEQQKPKEAFVPLRPGKHDALILSDNNSGLQYKLSACCNPIPGDDVFGFITISDGIKIHRANCPNAVQLRSNYDYRVIKAKWASQKEQEFLSHIAFTGIDDIGLVNNITNAISRQLHVNMKAISFESHDGIFEGSISLYVYSTDHLNSLIKELKGIKGVMTIMRTDKKEDD